MLSFLLFLLGSSSLNDWSACSVKSLDSLKCKLSLSFTEIRQVLDNSCSSVNFSLNLMLGDEEARLGVLLLLELLVVGLVLV